VKLGLLGGAGVAAYWYFVRPMMAASSPAPAAANPNAIVGANTADGIFLKLQAAGGNTPKGVDDWDVILMQVAPQLGTAPDPMPLFQAAVPGFDRGQLLTAAQYWNVLAPWLKANKGLSGLGMYATLGNLAWGRAA
jgi:hypothetical protein